jgi:hypothetical protein
LIPNRLIASFLIFCLTFTQAAQAYSLAWLPHQPIPNNGGDLGKTLNDLGQSQHIKALATAMVTAGALQGLNTSLKEPHRQHCQRHDQYRHQRRESGKQPGQ